ncbi:MAG: DUF2946 domain-containing protein [Bradyrhizobium sp.]
MRRRLHQFLPIVLLALTVQVLTPVASCWAAGIVVSDPLFGAADHICHDGRSQGDQSDHHHLHDGVCLICCVGHASGLLNTPQPIALAGLDRISEPVIWRDTASRLSGARAKSNAQARAPPLAM